MQGAKTLYQLKKSQPTNLVEPLVKFIQINQSPNLALQFRDSLNKINDLRNKATSLQMPTDASTDTINKYITVIEMYAKFAYLISKHFNWNPEYGMVVEDLTIFWFDSFNKEVKFSKNQIHYDLFCSFYNLGILNFEKARILCSQDLISSRKQSMASAKSAFYYFNTMRTYYYQGFVNTGFSDTNYSHLEILQSLCLGIIYKNLFNSFKEDQYKIGIQKIACLAVLAQQNFYKAYQIGTNFFMKSSSISNHVKSQLLSFAYVQSLYHDVIGNAKYAKYYQNQMDNNKSHIVNVIAYQRKALRLLELGLKNQSVSHLLDERKQQKKQLEKLKPDLQIALEKNVTRNKQIYNKQQIAEENIPPVPQPPKQYIVNPKQPQCMKPDYTGSIGSLFTNLVDNESKAFNKELKQFSINRINGMESALAKLMKNIQIIYNDNFVNYYVNLQQSNKKQGVPDTLKKKLQQIKSNGGKQKIEIQIHIIKSNSQQITGRFGQLKNMITQQQKQDNEKRNQYSQKWKRPPSSAINRTYIDQINNYEKKASQADAVNMKLIEKYQGLQKYIAVINGSDNEILAILPKIQLSKFLQANKAQFNALKQGVSSIQQKKQGLDALTDEIRKFFDKMDFDKLANQYYHQAATQKQVVLDQIFGKGYKYIENFNEKAKVIEQQAKKIGQISLNLNSKNTGDESVKKQFQVVMSKFTDISNLFRELAQGTSFYTKLNDILAKLFVDLQGFIAARKIQSQQLQYSINKGGNNGGPNLPSMYPNQQQNNNNMGYYVPPPPQYGNMGGNSYAGYQSSGSVSDMLKDLMSSKPSFSADIFGGPVFQSKYK